LVKLFFNYKFESLFFLFFFKVLFDFYKEFLYDLYFNVAMEILKAFKIYFLFLVYFYLKESSIYLILIFKFKILLRFEPTHNLFMFKLFNLLFKIFSLFVLHNFSLTEK